MEDLHSCPVCDYRALEEPPWVGDHGSHEICESCGTHFGYDDACGGNAAARPARYAELRAKWLEAGRPWFGLTRRKPHDWPPASLQTRDE